MGRKRHYTLPPGGLKLDHLSLDLCVACRLFLKFRDTAISCRPTRTKKPRAVREHRALAPRKSRHGGPSVARRLRDMNTWLITLASSACFETIVSQTEQLPLKPQPLTAAKRVITCRYHGQPQLDWQASNQMNNAEPLDRRGVLTANTVSMECTELTYNYVSPAVPCTALTRPLLPTFIQSSCHSW
jgi:hypothetical protein